MMPSCSVRRINSAPISATCLVVSSAFMPINVEVPNVPVTPGCVDSSAQMCQLRFGSHHDHGRPVGGQCGGELGGQLFGGVDVHCPTSETCCDRGDIETRQIKSGHIRGFLQQCE